MIFFCFFVLQNKKKREKKWLFLFVSMMILYDLIRWAGELRQAIVKKSQLEIHAKYRRAWALIHDNEFGKVQFSQGFYS